VRQIEHLPNPVTNINRPAQLAPTATAHQRDMIDNPVRDSDLLQTPARMTVLTSRLAARRTPQTLRRRLGQPV
jgi:hypothetical protein